MQLESLKLYNFRQFHGEHVLTFATKSEKSVTVILGQNGFGKSTLLAAIYWVFYGKTQPEFRDPNELLSEPASKTTDTIVSVEVTFVFEGSKYTLKRSRSYRFFAGGRKDYSDHESMLVTDVDTGKSTPVDGNRIAAIVARALPVEMVSAFFFDGENRSKQMALANKAAVSRGIRQILGCSFVEMIANDLAQVGRKLRKSVAEEPSGEQEANFYRSHESRIQIRDELTNNIENSRANVLQYEKKELELEEFLRAHHHASKIQALVDRKKSDLRKYESDLTNVTTQYISWLSTYGIEAISLSACIAAEDKIDEEELKGKLPSDIRETYIEKLLEDSTCICERELPEGSSHRRAIQKLLEGSTHPVVVDSALHTRTFYQVLNRGYKKANSVLNELEADRVRLEQLITTTKQEIEAQLRLMEGSSVEEIQKKANLKKEIRKKIEEETLYIGNQSRKIQVEIEPAIKQFAEAITRYERNKPAMRRKTLLRDLAEQLSSELKKRVQTYEDRARERIVTSINKYVKKMHANYEVALDDSYCLILRHPITKSELPRSEGEDQLLTLVFTAALIEECGSRADAPDRFLLPGTVAPLVLDSIFGKLDKQYRRTAVELLSSLTKQTIFLASDSQAEELFESAALSSTGAKYVLIKELGPTDQRSDAGEPYKILSRTFTSSRSGSVTKTVIESIS